MSDDRLSIHVFTERGEPVTTIEHLQARIEQLERLNERLWRIIKVRREMADLTKVGHAKPKPSPPIVH